MNIAVYNNMIYCNIFYFIMSLQYYPCVGSSKSHIVVHYVNAVVVTVIFIIVIIIIMCNKSDKKYKIPRAHQPGKSIYI